MAKTLLFFLSLLVMMASDVAANSAFFSIADLEEALGDNANYTDGQKEILAERIFYSYCFISGTVVERPIIDPETGVSALTLRISEKPLVGKYAVVGFLASEVKKVAKLIRGQKIIVQGHLAQYNGFPNPVYGRSEVDKNYLGLIDSVIK